MTMAAIEAIIIAAAVPMVARDAPDTVANAVVPAAWLIDVVKS